MKCIDLVSGAGVNTRAIQNVMLWNKSNIGGNNNINVDTTLNLGTGQLIFYLIPNFLTKLVLDSFSAVLHSKNVHHLPNKKSTFKNLKSQNIQVYIMNMYQFFQ